MNMNRILTLDRGNSGLKAAVFESAAETIRGILDGLPDYLVTQQRAET